MKYEVVDRKTGQVLADCVVTQAGLVAWWDDTAGWREDEDQSRFEVLYPCKKALAKAIAEAGMRYDELGCRGSTTPNLDAERALLADVP